MDEIALQDEVDRLSDIDARTAAESVAWSRSQYYLLKIKLRQKPNLKHHKPGE
jgi:hypothetical protein